MKKRKSVGEIIDTNINLIKKNIDYSESVILQILKSNKNQNYSFLKIYFKSIFGSLQNFI